MDLPRRPDDAATPAPLPLPCLNASLRRAARAVTQLYEAEFRNAGVGGARHTLLQVIDAWEGIGQKGLGQRLALDSTTLSRTLAPLLRHGWIRTLPAQDRRERRFALTPAGRRQLDRARAPWERAQERMRKRLGAARWEQVMKVLLEVTRAAQGPMH